MKTCTPALCVALLAAVPALAQNKPAAKPVATSASRPVAATKPASRAAASAKPVAKPAPRPTPAPAKPTAATPRPAAVAPPAVPAVTQPAPAAGPAGANELFRMGTTVVNLGLGLGLGYGYGFGSGLKATPAMSLSVDKGIKEGLGPGVIGIGGLIGYKGYHYDYPGTDYKAQWNNFIVLVRATYHYDLLQNGKLDTYAGVSVGARIENYKDTYYDDYLGSSYKNSYGGTRAEGGIFIGGRYYFTEMVGAFAEAGYDMSYLKLGLSARF